MNNSPLNILVFGSGAIGTYVGGSLARQEHRVVFLDRPEMAAQLRATGLRLTLPDGQHRIPAPKIVTSVDEALSTGAFDAVLFAVKSYDTESAIAPLAPYADQLPPFVCLQNGVDNEPALAKHFGENKVIAGTLTSAIGKPGVGEIVVERLRGMGVAGSHPLAPRLADALDAAGLRARHYARAADMKWSKLLTNLIANPTSAILDLPPSDIFAHRGLFKLEIEQLREALAVMDALGARVVNLPGTPVRALAFAARRLPLPIAQPLLARALGKGRGGKMPSFHIDLHHGSGRSEVGYLHGAVVRHGEKLDIPTPVNRLLTSTLLALTKGEYPLNTYARQPGKFIAELSN